MILARGHSAMLLLISTGTGSAQPRAAFNARIAAFTLLEILLAVAVFAIVLSAVTGVYFGALRLRNKTVAAFEAALPIELATQILKRDLACLALPGGRLSGTFQTAIVAGASTGALADRLGQRVTPDLFTTTGQIDEWSPFGGIQKVAYYLAQPTNAAVGFDLIRATTRNLLPVTTEEFEAQFLMSGVQSMMLWYFDGSQWVDTWDSTTSSNLPSAIRVQLQLSSPVEVENTRSGKPMLAPVELVVPVLAQASTAAATGGAQ